MFRFIYEKLIFGKSFQVSFFLFPPSSPYCLLSEKKNFKYRNGLQGGCEIIMTEIFKNKIAIKAGMISIDSV